MSKYNSETTSWAQNGPFLWWQDLGEPQLKEGQYFLNGSSNVEIWDDKKYVARKQINLTSVMRSKHEIEKRKAPL